MKVEIELSFAGVAVLEDGFACLRVLLQHTAPSLLAFLRELLRLPNHGAEHRPQL